jgi:hypothetical protein
MISMVRDCFVVIEILSEICTPRPNLDQAVKQVLNQMKILTVSGDGALQVPALEFGPKSDASVNKAKLYAKQSGPMVTHDAGTVSAPTNPLPSSTANSPGKVYRQISLSKAGHPQLTQTY